MQPGKGRVGQGRRGGRRPNISAERLRVYRSVMVPEIETPRPASSGCSTLVDPVPLHLDLNRRVVDAEAAAQLVNNRFENLLPSRIVCSATRMWQLQATLPAPRSTHAGRAR